MLFSDDMNMDLLLNNYNKNDLLVNKEIGLIRGNMFKDEYIPYKNIEPSKIVASNPKDELKLKIYQLYFAITDLNLYLDLNENQEVFNIYKDYLLEYDNLKKEYEKEFGPLEITCITRSYDWNNNPWPWDKNGGIKYV